MMASLFAQYRINGLRLPVFREPFSLDTLSRSLNYLHLICHYLVGNPLSSISSYILSVPESSDDMYSRAFLQLIEVLNVLSFPGCDIVPGGFNDCAAILGGISMAGSYADVGNFGVHEALYVNAPDDAPDFNLV